jgi:hypothetical protein
MGWVCVACAVPCRARDGHEMMTEAFFAVPPSLQVATEEGSFSLLRKKKKQIGGWGGDFVRRAILLILGSLGPDGPSAPGRVQNRKKILSTTLVTV